MCIKFNLISKSISTVFLILLLPAASTALAEQKCDQATQATTPTSRFIVNDNQTVLDTETQLIWKQCPQGLSGESCNIGEIAGHTWKDALKIAEQEHFAGQTDWRLPDLPELLSIVEHQCSNPALNLAVFPIEQNWFFWSWKPDPDPRDSNINSYAYMNTFSDADSAWGVDTYSLERSKTKQDTRIPGAIRLVRGKKVTKLSF